MTVETVMDVAVEAIWTMIITSAPLLIISLAIGLIVSIIQAVTSIQEQTLTFVPKILSIFITLILCGGWIMDNIVSFMERLFEGFSTYVR